MDKEINDNELFKRVGKIEVPQRLISNFPDNVKLILQDVLIVDATTNFHESTITYVGYSEHFDAIEEVEEIPTYTVIGHNKGIDFHRMR